MVLKFENLRCYGKYWYKKDNIKNLLQKFSQIKIDAKLPFV